MEVLINNPILGNSLISFLLCKSDDKNFTKNNEILHGLYIHAVNELLNEVSSATSSQNSERQSTQKNIYQILSLYNPESYQNYEVLRTFFSRLFELSSLPNPALDRTMVLSSFVGRSQDYLVQEFCAYEYEIETKRTPLPREAQGGDFSEDQQRLLHIAGETDQCQQLHHFFLMCLKKQQHLLSNVVVRFMLPHIL